MELLKLFSKGVLPGSAVQRLAAAAWADGWGRDDEVASKLYRAGAYGQHVQNIQRDLLRAAAKAGLTEDTPEPYYFNVPGPGGIERQAQCVLIHEMHRRLMEGGDGGAFCLPPEELEADHGLGALLSEWAEHPDVSLGRPPVDVAPIGLHGDGVQYQSSMRAGEGKTIYAISYNYLHGSPKQRGRRFLLTTLRKAAMCDCGCEGFHTLDAFFKVVAWSMQGLASGLAPSRRHDGSEWTQHDRKHRVAAGARLPLAAMLMYRGDWEWHSLSVRFRHVGNVRFCFLCNAEHGGVMSYINFARDAPHRATLLTFEQVLAACAMARISLPSLLLCPGTSLKHFALDVMHSGDLGSFQDCLGSLFWIEVTNRAWHRNQAEGLLYLNRELALFYQANPQFTKLKLTMRQLRSPDVGYPTLKAKAAQTRHAVHFGVMLAAKHAHGGAGRAPFSFRPHSRLAAYAAEYRTHVLACLQALQQFLLSCEEEGFDADRCCDHLMAFLHEMEHLHALWRRHLPLEQHHAMPWHIRPKCHAFEHIALDQLRLWGSPRRTWCYGDENFVGQIKNVAMRSKHPRTLEDVVMRKVQLASGIRAWEMEEE